MKIRTKLFQAATALGLAMSLAHAGLAETQLQFYFPVSVGGKAADTIQGLTSDYMAQNPDVKIDAVYAGSYGDTLTKALTAFRAGNPPQLSVIAAAELFTLVDEDAVVAVNDLISTDADREWLRGFYPAFLKNSTLDGKTYGVPFQRSTPVMYYNKDAFTEAGLDPNHPPENWAELVEMGKKLTKRDADGNVTQWGLRIPSSGFPWWLFQGLAWQNDALLMNPEGTETYYDDPKVVEALQFMVDLSMKHEIMAPGINDWGTTPKAFFEGKVAIMYTTTGNLTNVRDNAPFDFGVAMLPGNVHRGAPTGGGDFFIFKGSSDAQNAAAIDFLKWVTAPEQAARWTIGTGYVAPRPDDWESPVLKQYSDDFPPALVSIEQLPHTTRELSTHEGARVRKILDEALEAAIIGNKEPGPALAAAQAKAERVLKAYR